MRERRQKTHATWLTRILNHILCLTLVLASLPNIPLSVFQNPTSGVNLLAKSVGDSPPTNDDDPSGGGSLVDSGTKIEDNTMPGGSQLTADYVNIEDGSSDITKAGIYVGGDSSNYLNVYMNQKKASNSICYRTVGFAITKGKVSEPDLSFAWTYPRVEIGISYSDCNTKPSTGYYNDGGGFHGESSIEFTNKDSNNKIYQNDTYHIDGQDYTGTNFKVSKLALRKYLGLPADSGHTVYLHSINNIRNGAGKWIKSSSADLFRSGKATQVAMQSLGFSSTSQSDMRKMYNIPIQIDKAKFTMSIIDVNNAKVLKYSDLVTNTASTNYIGGAIVPQSEVGCLAMSSEDVDAIIGDGNKYDLLGGCIIANNFPESSSSSGYLESVIKPNLQAGMAPEKSFYMSTSQTNTIASSGYKPTSDLSDSAKYTLNGFMADKGSFTCNVYTYGTKYAGTPEPLVSSPGGSMIYGVTNDLSLGLNMYLFVQTSQKQDDLTGDFAVGYAADTGNKLFSAAIDYKEMQDKIDQLEADGYEVLDYVTAHNKYYELMNDTYPDKSEFTITYKFPSSVKSAKGDMYVYDAYNIRLNTTLKDDVQKTKTERAAGKDVLHDGVLGNLSKVKVKRKMIIKIYEKNYYKYPEPVKLATIEFEDDDPALYRGRYVNTYAVPVLYYSDLNGELLKRTTTSSCETFLAQDYIEYNGKKYYSKKISYKEGITAEADIAKTTVPVMTSEDKNITEGNEITIPSSVYNKMPPNYIIRVACNLTPNKKNVLGENTFVIPSQNLTNRFTWVGPPNGLEAHIEQKFGKTLYTHEYKVGEDLEGNPIYSTCTVSDQYVYKVHQYDWDDNPGSVLNPLTNVFADRGGITKIGNLKVSGSFDLATTFSMDFISHREAVDNVCPVFAKYKQAENQQALNFLKTHQMQDLAVVDLVPNTRYNNAGGSESVQVELSGGNKSDYHGMLFDYLVIHSGCDIGTIKVIEDGLQSTMATSGYYKGTVEAEPSIVATPLPVGTAVVEKVGTVTDNKTTYYSTGSGNIKFYPTYKMYVDGSDAWLLGKEERQLKAVNVAEIEVLNTQPIMGMSTTWSRDSQDTGRPSMKSGYVYKTKTNEPMRVKVTTYSVVPKVGYVKDSETVRNKILKNHDDLVAQVSNKDNYMLLTNLPEAYLAKCPDEWKKNNPFKTGADNTIKCKLDGSSVINTTKGATAKTTMTLAALDAAFDKCDNVERLKAQLESKDWYVEEFDGIEVVKQETEISITCGEVSAVNFVRNGGKSTNDLASPAGNINAGQYGIEIGYYCPTTKIYGVDFDVQKLTLPKVFEVRGTAYDDRSN